MLKLNLINISNSDINYELINFPDGQPHLRLENKVLNEDKCVIYTRLSNPGDVLLLAFAVDALRRMGIVQIDVTISYLLAARMDRVMIEGEPHSVKVMGGLLNSLRLNSVSIFDPHSDVSVAVIDNCSGITNTKLVNRSLKHFKENYNNESVTLVSPDAGALKKVAKVAEKLHINDVVACSKSRNLSDGKLSSFKVNANTLEGKTCFIVDDICDGGGTFVGVAKELKNKGAAKVILIVSHGIFSKGFIIENIDYVYSTNSYKAFDKTPDHIHLFNIEEVW